MKRLLDVTLSGLGLIALAPVAGVVALLVRWKLGSPLMFRQQRPGLRAEPFSLLKFRTMTDQRDANGQLLPNDQRLTSFGKRVRNTSLDELPELINVLRGEMSLVGPRPLRMEYLPLYSPYQARRHEVRPGLTGLAQVLGRNDLGWEERFEIDVWYVDNRSLLLDVKILARTIIVAFRREGVHAIDGSTVKPFTGSDEGAGA